MLDVEKAKEIKEKVTKIGGYYEEKSPPYLKQFRQLQISVSAHVADFLIDAHRAFATGVSFPATPPLDKTVLDQKGLSAETVSRIKTFAQIFPSLATRFKVSTSLLNSLNGLSATSFLSPALQKKYRAGELSFIYKHASNPTSPDERRFLYLVGFHAMVEHVTSRWKRDLINLSHHLQEHRDLIVDILSQPTLWRADSTIDSAKAMKSVCNRVSIDFQSLEGRMGWLALELGVDPAAQRLGTINTGLEFEGRLFELFSAIGLKCERTAMTGDFGVDLILTVRDRRIAVQAKDHAAPVGVSAVMEVTAGAKHHRCDTSVVVAQQGFTEAAIKLANSTNTALMTEASLIAKLRNSVATQMLGAI